MITATSIEEKLRFIAGTEHLRAATADDAVCGVQPQFVAEPQDEQHLAALLSCANEAGLAVIPRGGGTKLTWGNRPARANLILSTAAMNRIREHAWADLTVTVEAGCTMRSLQEELAKHGQRLALDALWPERATIGGVLSTNDSGALRLRFGALRDLIIGVTLALPDGTIASSGGKVVKNVAGYDLPKLVTGALGTLGVITRAVFRLHPMPRSTRTLSFETGSIEEMQKLLLSIQDSQLAHTAFQIRCGSSATPAADILIEATEAGLSAQEARLRSMLGAVSMQQSSIQIWNARQELFSRAGAGDLLAKFTILPSWLALTVQLIDRLARPQNLHWQAVIQATGIGTLLLQGPADALRAVTEQLRAELEQSGASFVLFRRPRDLEAMDAWGNAGDALALMRATKYQLDPKNTLNPGRFVGGI